jgi:hypothetical protein
MVSMAELYRIYKYIMVRINGALCVYLLGRPRDCALFSMVLEILHEKKQTPYFCLICNDLVILLACITQ